MIKSLKVTGLNRSLSFDLKFHEDINIITGRNGSGKTTVLELIWYAINGHLDRIISEIPFDSFEPETDEICIVSDRRTVGAIAAGGDGSRPFVWEPIAIADPREPAR